MMEFGFLLICATVFVVAAGPVLAFCIAVVRDSGKD